MSQKSDREPDNHPRLSASHLSGLPGLIPLELALRFAGLGAWSVDLRTKLLSCDDATRLLFGHRSEGFQNSLDFLISRVTPSDRDALKSDIDRAVASRSYIHRDLQIKLPDRSKRTVSIYGEVVCDRDGEPLRLCGVSKDVTALEPDAHEGAESSSFAPGSRSKDVLSEKLQDSSAAHAYSRERRYVMAGARCLFWYADIYETGGPHPRWEIRIPDLDAAQRFLPLDLPNGAKYADAWYNSRLAADREKTDLYGNAAVRKGRNYDQEYRCTAKNGSIVWMHEDIRVEVIVPGVHWRAIAICTDVTERRTGEMALRESEERLKAALHAGNMGIWEWDIVNDRITWSEETDRLFDIPVGSFDGKLETYYSFLIPEERESLRKSMHKAIVEHSTFEQEHRVVRADGSTRWLLGKGAAYYDQDGKPVRFMGTLADITDRKRLEQQFLQAQKMDGIGRLAGGVAHDFNNLLSVILGYAEMMEPELEALPEQLACLQSIHLAAERAAHLTSQLLAFARSQTASTTVLSPNDLLSGMSKILKPLIRENISMELRLSADTGSLRVDRNQIEQVVINLVLNAVDAMPNGGKLVISSGAIHLSEQENVLGYAVPPGDFVEIVVADTGIGMSDAVKSRLFEPFFTTKDVGKGTGLGLATVYGIVKQSNGYIFPESVAGAGTAMHIYLPRVDDAPENMVDEDTTTVELRGTETILVVEDEDLVRSLTVTILESNGYRVMKTENGREAIAAIETSDGSIDLVITDAIMPDMGGRELVDNLARRWPEIRVMVLSGYTEELAEMQAILPEGIGYLQKPFSVRSLMSKVREALDRR